MQSLRRSTQHCSVARLPGTMPASRLLVGGKSCGTACAKAPNRARIWTNAAWGADIRSLQSMHCREHTRACSWSALRHSRPSPQDRKLLAGKGQCTQHHPFPPPA